MNKLGVINPGSTLRQSESRCHSLYAGMTDQNQNGAEAGVSILVVSLEEIRMDGYGRLSWIVP